MEFEFIKELSEARIFRNPKKIDETSVSDLADNFFSVILAMQILRHLDPKYAKQYSLQTIQGNALDGWRSSGSDLHNMGIMLSNPAKYKDKISLDRHISLPELQYKTWLRNMSNEEHDFNYDRRFLLKLQQNLGIRNLYLRSVRRTVADWEDASTEDRRLAASRINLFLRRDLKDSDIYALYNKIMLKKNLLFKDLDTKKRGS